MDTEGTPLDAAGPQPWGSFLDALAHKLRNPLGPIRTAAYLLRAKAAQDPELERLRGMIDRQGAALADLLDILTDVAKAGQGALAIRRSPADLGEILAGCLEACSPRLAERNQRVTLDLRDQPWGLDGDAPRLARLLDALLANACRFSPPGAEIHIQAMRRGGTLRLCVQDPGAGMDPETLARLFSLFHRGEGAPAGGLGVGLALARQVAQLHGGTLTASSPGPGKGSAFTLDLPLRVAAGAPGPAPEDLGASVLLIDDDANDRLLNEILLEEMGYRVTQAASGEAGLARGLAEHPDIALVDFELGGMDGPAVAARLRAGLGPSIFLVALTGHGDGEALARARSAGFDAFVVKGSDPALLVRTLRDRSAG